MRSMAPFLLVLAFLAGCVVDPPLDTPVSPEPQASPPASHVVAAHIDTGVNPYHVAFRWDSPLAWQHPSTYLPTYPEDAVELRLTLDAATYAEALETDAAAWDGVERGTLYWIPGTRIVGAISFGPGGTYCPTVPAPPANQLDPTGDCPERILLDDFGHGTMTASRMAGGNHSLAPEALILSVEGTSLEAVEWVAAAGFVDVVSNSWGYLTPTATNTGEAARIRAAAQHNLWLFASGNGLGFVNGVAGQPTQASPTFPPGVVIVGAHDNGYATSWHGAPPHVVADGFGGWRANAYDLAEWSPSPESCCTSAAAPYAAGGAAAILLEARRILWDPATGAHTEPGGDNGANTIMASIPVHCANHAPGCPPLPASGPLADGLFTLGEFRALLKATATPRPPVTDEASDDGLVNWGATPGSTPASPWPGDNPYCLGCSTSPVPLSSVPEDQSLAASIGYGAVDGAGAALAAAVLRGEVDVPDRPAEDAFFAADEAAREAAYPPPGQ